jgi:hypothetical protein
MKHLKIILFATLVCLILTSILYGLYYSIFEGKNVLYGFAIVIYYLVIAIPILIFISGYHFGLILLTKYTTPKFLKKLLVWLFLNLIYAILYILNNPSDLIMPISITLLCSIIPVLCYELTIFLFKKLGGR